MNFLGINMKKLEKKYSREQITGFLSDLATDQGLPAPAREAAKLLLNQYQKGESLNKCVKIAAKAMIKDLEKQKQELKDGVQLREPENP